MISIGWHQEFQWMDSTFQKIKGVNVNDDDDDDDDDDDNTKNSISKINA